MLTQFCEGPSVFQVVVESGASCAVKVVDLEELLGETTAASFSIHWQIFEKLKVLNHANIVNFVNAVPTSGKLLLISELFVSDSLRSVLDGYCKGKGLPEGAARGLLHQVSPSLSRNRGEQREDKRREDERRRGKAEQRGRRGKKREERERRKNEEGREEEKEGREECIIRLVWASNFYIPMKLFTAT